MAERISSCPSMSPARGQAHPQSGMSLVETLVALSVLGLGVAMLWYALGAAKRSEINSREKTFALNLAQSEIETLRSLPIGDLADTAYPSGTDGNKRWLIERKVMNDSLLPEVWEAQPLGEAVSAHTIPPPVEVQVRVFQIAVNAFGSETQSEEPAVSLHLFLPRYLWH